MIWIRCITSYDMQWPLTHTMSHSLILEMGFVISFCYCQAKTSQAQSLMEWFSNNIRILSFMETFAMDENTKKW